MANQDFATILPEQEFQRLQRALPLLDEIINKQKILVANANKINANSPSSGSARPSQANANTTSNNANTQQANGLLREQERLIQKIADARKSEALENAKLRIELANLNKEQKKQAQEALGVLNAYQKLDAELGQVRLQAKGLAADMFNLEQAGQRNTQEYRDLEATYTNVAARVNLLDTNLRRIDSSLGQNQRNVGNYASGWNGLGNSINQITREFPAFTYSVQTGFLALSNNIPILADELSRLVAQNQALIAQGQPTVSVFKQILGALLSWQTSLSVGVTLLTIYAKDLSNFAANLFKTQQALNAVTRSQEVLNAVRNQSQKDIVDEITTYQLYLQTARDEEKSLVERQIAVKKLQSEYAFYFGKLSEQQILAGETAKAESDVNKALEARANTVGISKQYNDVQVALVTINQNLIKSRKEINAEEATQARLRKAGRDGSLNALQVTGQLLESYDRETKAKGVIKTLLTSENYYRAINNKLIEEAIQNKKDSIGLEYQETEAKKLNTEASVDFIASQYELIKTRLDNEASLNKRVFEDEEVNYERREVAANRYNEILRELADRRLEEELRLIKRSSDEDVKSIQERIRNEEVTESSGRKAIYSIQKQAQYDSLTAYENYAEDLRQVDISIEESLKGVWNAINFQKASNLISERDLQNTKDYADVLSKMSASDDYRKLEEAERDYFIANRQITKANIQVDIDKINTDLRALKDTEANVQKRLELQNHLITKEKELTSVTAQESKERAEAYKVLQTATETYLKTFQDGFFDTAGLSSLQSFFDQVTYTVVNKLGELETKTGSTFQKLLDGANTTGEKFAVTFNAIGNVAKEAFAFINQNSQAYFDNEASRLQRMYDLEISFNEGSETAKAEIKRQYDEKQRELRRRESQAQKEQALFNIAINTAQGITAALTSTPPNVPLSIIIGAIGVAQAALVAGREIPQYRTGTDNHKGGLAIVGDGGKHELVHQPTLGWSVSPDKSTMVNLEKGSKVFPDLSKVGLFDSGLPDMIKLQGGGLTESQMDGIASRFAKKMPKPIMPIIGFDKKGAYSYMATAAGKEENRNNIFTFKGTRT